MPLRKEVDLEKTVAAASGVFRDVCSEEPPYHTAEELSEGLKQGGEGARLLFVFFLCCCVRVCARPRAKKWYQKMLLVVLRATRFSKNGFPKD